MHYASLTPGIRENDKVAQIVGLYRQGDLDFHQMVADMAGGIDRFLAKTINLGIMYGMGLGKLATTLGNIPIEEAKTLRNDYDEKVPFIRDLASRVMTEASNKKEIRTLLGRKCRFPLREPRRWDKNNPTAPIHVDKLEEIWRDILETPVEDRGDGWPKYNPQNYRVAFVFKALNKLIQASSADQTKQAMKDCADNGYVPMLTVHDELCISIESDEQVNHITELMETCVKMRVPSKVDVGIGENWGLAK